MATNVISDDELRKQLQSLGENPGPVTPSTRPLLLRKLRKLEKEGTRRAKETKKDSRRKSAPPSSHASSQTKRQSPSRKLLGFSSDEEDNQSNSRSRRRASSGRGARIKEEFEESKDDVDGNRDDFEKPRDRSKSGENQRGRSTVHGFNDSPTIRDEFSDSDSTTYTGPFQRGSFRFRSFRRKKDSPESANSNRQIVKDKVNFGDEMPSDHNATDRDSTDGAYSPRSEGNSLSSFINIVALFVVIICMVLLGVYYLNDFHLNNYGITSSSGPLSVCSNSIRSNCVHQKDLNLKYVHFLIGLLSKKAGQFDCEDESVTSRNVSKDELIKQLDAKIVQDFPDLSVKRKSQIQIDVIEFLNNKTINETGVRIYDEEKNLLGDNTSSAYWYESIKPNKSLVCRIQQSCSKVMTGTIILAFVFLILVGVYYGVRNHWRKEEEDTRMMYKFVENIIDILRKHHDACKTDKDLPPYLPIPHVRDMLIKPAERKAKANVWSRAVRFLSANESRIRVESQRIAGEDFEVWRWIHIMSPKHHSHKVSLQDTKRPKCWQGQAFENFQWAVNPPVVSPTPCLKIRNMFDPDVELEDRWHVIIQDAILEKCIDAGANIVHIAVDKSSSEGCVYVKCNSKDSAGVAFKSLHGSWFDGRLVAVKYLTLRRYHQRFPKALTATGSLKLSGTSPSSLVTLDPEEDIDANDSETEV